jgi:hypothetical protein
MNRLRHTPFLAVLAILLWALAAEVSAWFQDSPGFERVATVFCVLGVILAIGVAFSYVRHPARTYRGTVAFVWILIVVDLFGARWFYFGSFGSLALFLVVLVACTLLAFRKNLSECLHIHRVRAAIQLQQAGFVLAIAATGIALYYTFENWRWKRAWENYVHQQKAAGTWVDEKVVPVPDAENYAMIPLFHRGVGPEKFNVPNFSLTRTNDATGLFSFRGNWHRAQAINLEALQTYYRGGTNFPTGLDWDRDIGRYLKQLANGETGANVQFPTSEKPQSAAEDVLLALSIYADDLAQLSEEMDRPYTQFLKSYEPRDIRLGHLALARGVCVVLRTRATAHLAAGHLDHSFSDVLDSYRISDRITQEPLLINWLVRITAIELSHHGLWESLLSRRWQDAHLQAIQNELAQIDIFKHLGVCLLLERMFTGKLMERTAETRLNETLIWQLSRSYNRFVAWAPAGWFYSSALEASLLVDQMKRACAAPTRTLGFSFESTRIGAWKRHPDVWNYLARHSWVATISKHWEKACRAQTSANMAITACALERFFLKHDSYPLTLKELVPAFLPSVPIDHADGNALRYRRSQDGRYRIYSIGIDGIDENGKLLSPRNSKNEWVWCYAQENTDWQPPGR